MPVERETCITRLHAKQLDWAADDLRNASLVVKHAHHFKGTHVDRRTGRVCILGAIELATYKELVDMGTDGQPFWVTMSREDWALNGIYRCDSAILVLAEVIPEGLCPACEEGKLFKGWERVAHYNDNHCIAEALAINMLRLAADYAQQLAEERRMLVA